MMSQSYINPSGYFQDPNAQQEFQRPLNYVLNSCNDDIVAPTRNYHRGYGQRGVMDVGNDFRGYNHHSKFLIFVLTKFVLTVVFFQSHALPIGSTLLVAIIWLWRQLRFHTMEIR